MKQRSQNIRNQRRRLAYECLESRRLLAADLVLFQNPLEAVDVNNDDQTSPVDALYVINELNGATEGSSKVSAFYDTSGDGVLAPIDALTVINTLNHPELSEDGFADKLAIAAGYLEANMGEIDGSLIDLTNEIIGLHEKIESVEETIRAQLNDFLNYSVENADALADQMESLEVAYHASEELFYREFVGLNDEFDAAQQQFDPNGDPSQQETDSGFEFDPATEYSEEVFEEIVEELDELDTEYDLPDYSGEYDGYDDYVDTYNPETTEVNDYVLEQVTPDDYEQWVLDGGDFGDMLDGLDEDAFVGDINIDDYVQDTFGDPSVAVNYLQDLIDNGYVGEMFYGDLAAIGGETTGSGIETSDGTMIEIDLNDDPLLISMAEQLDGENVLIDGYLTTVKGVEIPERIVLEVIAISGESSIRDTATALASVEYAFATETSMMLVTLADKVRDA